MDSGTGQVRRGQVTKAVMVAVILQLLGNATGLVIGYVTGGSFNPIVIALTVTGASVVMGLAVVLLPRSAGTAEDRLPAPPPPSGPSGPYRPPRPQARRMSGVSIVTAIVVMLVLCGAGGLAATWGIQKGFNAVWGAVNPVGAEGTQRLVAPVTGRSGPLRITVQGVEVTSRITKVKILLRHDGQAPVTLPVYGNAQFILAGGQTLAARGQDMIDVPVRVDVERELAFNGVPDPAARTATLSFSHVISQRFEVDSITVPNIRLTVP